MTIKNITLSAEERLIELAREKAMLEKKSFNTIFREWLTRYVGNDMAIQNYKQFMKELKYVKAGKRFSRDELNER